MQNYVGQRAEWFVASRLRAAPPLPEPETEPAPRDPTLEHRDSVRRVMVAIERRWPILGPRLFHLLFVLQLPSKEAGAELGLSCEAIDQWRCRLREFARAMLLQD